MHHASPPTSTARHTSKNRRHLVAITAALTALFATGLAAGLVAGAASAQAAPAPRPTPSPAAGSAPAPAPSPNKATFGIQPSGARQVDGRGFFDFNATPGATVTDYVAVTNYALKPVTLTVVATDAVNNAAGDFALLPPGKPVRGVGAWITLPASGQRVTIPARHHLIIPFRLAIPPGAIPGDHAGGILATLTSLAQSPSGQKLRLVQSVGSRVFVRVSGPLHARLSIRNLHATYHGRWNPLASGSATVSYVVTNTGNVALGGLQAVHVSGLLGIAGHSPKVPTIRLLLPGYSMPVQVHIAHVVPQILMTATVTLRPAILAGTTQQVPRTFTASTHFWAVPWLLLLIVALVLWGLIRFVRRRFLRPSPRGRRAQERAPAPKVLVGAGGRHRGTASRIAAIVGATVAAVVASAVPTGVAHADSNAPVPYTDRNAHGYLGLCDAHGHSIHGGSLTDQPFVWKALSSAPAPNGYGGPRAKATLYAFQPRQGVDPGDWSGEQLTGSSTFSNPKHPAAQSTGADQPLISFVGGYPPNWQGLIQLRMYFSAPDTPPYLSTYPATDIRVSGNRWQVVRGGDVACASSQGKSGEVNLLPAKRLASAPVRVVNPAKPGASPATSPGAGTSAGGGAPNSDSRNSAATANASSGSDGIVIGLLAAAVVVLAGLSGFLFWRRRAPHVTTAP
ncbi:MAG: DUF916 domain-containing protein [Frankiaceae bacterium]|nr:DUF916 domain-containing protein [Frankiaceae bacterium]